MADEAAGLGKTPKALESRSRSVGLSDGTVIIVHRWSWVKFKELIMYVGTVDGAQTVAEQSVEEVDRPKVLELSPSDLLKVYNAAVALNEWEEALGNLVTLLGHGKKLRGALGIEGPNPPTLPEEKKDLSKES